MKPTPTNPLQVPRFGGIATFSRLPYSATPKRTEADVVIVGIPFDGGTTYRPGARHAPRALRDASVLCRNVHAEHKINIYEELRVVDGGDVAVNPINLQTTFRKIESHLGGLHSQGMRTISLGGDHSLLLPELRAVSKHHRNPVLIQFDAHTDTADQAWGEKYHHGTPIRRAIEEKLIRGRDVFQIGIRGPLTSLDQLDFDRKHGIRALTMQDFHSPAKKKKFMNALMKHAKGRPVFITFDVDGVDPAYAPGTGTPVVGGLTSFEALSLLREMAGLKVIGGDVVEISPPYDHAEITSLLGAAIVFEMLALMALT